MRISDSPDPGAGAGRFQRLSVSFEQDGCEEIEGLKPDYLDSNNNNDDDNDQLSGSQWYIADDGENATDEVQLRRKSSGNRSQNRDRNFVAVAGGAVFDGARTVARKIKRISLNESGGNQEKRMEVDTENRSPSSSAQQRLKSSARLKQHYNSTPSLLHSSSSSLSPLVQVHPSGSVLSLGGASAAGNGGLQGFTTAKQHDQQASASAAASTASGISSSISSGVGTLAGGSSGGAAAGLPAPEKEKKRKEVSSSRVKKFHRHFSQVSKDEKLINYFSCALVGDILLQGHLYITNQHFAFYSNVFGYVTKVVIPTSSVTKISKEKTAKIIPNAVGVATADERHVFGSFISRESAFRLMCTVCTQLGSNAELLLPKQSQSADLEASEEYFVEDDSSCSISGNESPPQLLDASGAGAAAVNEPEATLRQRMNSSNSEKVLRHSDLQVSNSKGANLTVAGHAQIGMRSSAPPGVHYEAQATGGEAAAVSRSSSTSNSANGSAGSSGPSSSSSPITVVGVGSVPPSPASSSPAALADMMAGGAIYVPGARPSSSLVSKIRSLAEGARSRLQLTAPTEIHVLYLSVMLAVMLAIFSTFLLYRILNIEAKTTLYNTPVDFNWRSGNDEDLFVEALRWQKELQVKSTEEAQNILSRNLEQISKVRRSLETLSMLIHDRSNAYGQQVAALNPQTNRDEND